MGEGIIDAGSSSGGAQGGVEGEEAFEVVGQADQGRFEAGFDESTQ